MCSKKLFEGGLSKGYYIIKLTRAKSHLRNCGELF